MLRNLDQLKIVYEGHSFAEKVRVCQVEHCKQYEESSGGDPSSRVVSSVSALQITSLSFQKGQVFISVYAKVSHRGLGTSCK